MTKKHFGRIAVLLSSLMILTAAVYYWQYLHRDKGPESFASGNGRIEATSVNVATKTSGRLLELKVHEGDDVVAGQVLALMDTATLAAGLHEAEAQVWC